jgi:hypothetical protein
MLRTCALHVVLRSLALSERHHHHHQQQPQHVLVLLGCSSSKVQLRIGPSTFCMAFSYLALPFGVHVLAQWVCGYIICARPM